VVPGSRCGRGGWQDEGQQGRYALCAGVVQASRAHALEARLGVLVLLLLLLGLAQVGEAAVLLHEEAVEQPC
jgi:hypothetical protein